MEDAKKYYLNQSLDKEAHIKHTPIIIEVFNELKLIASEVDIESGDGMDSKIHRIQVRVLIDAVTSLMRSISVLLESEAYEGVDPLARVVLEHSINIIYLFDGEPKKSSKQFIRNYIDTTLKKSERWLSYAQESGDSIEVEIAQSKLEVLKQIKEINIGLYDGSCKKWPNAYDRFLKVGHEGAYVTLFAMNSDSVHGLSEDVYNYCLLPNYPDELQPYIVRNYRALSKSLSIYLAMKSVAFYGLAIASISNRLNASYDINSVLMKLNDIAIEHESETDDRWQG